MSLDSAGSVFFTIIAMYSLAAFLPVFVRDHKYSNIVSNCFNIVAAALGMIFSLMYFFYGSGPLSIADGKLQQPFMSIGIKIDNLSAFFILTLSLLVLCVSVYSIGYLSHYYGKRNVRLFNFLYSAFILSMLLVFTASNMVFFLIVWEVMALLSYFLVVFEKENTENQKAGTLYIIMTHLGTALLMIAFVILFSYTRSFDMYGDSSLIPAAVKNIIFLLMLAGFGTKAGVIPVHIWLPYAHPAAPSNISALMSGIMIKTAVYGILRFIAAYLGIQFAWWGYLILFLGVISAALGVIFAYVENNVKRLLAYSSIENIGIMMIGLGIGFIGCVQKNTALYSLALTASLFHLFNHTLMKGGLFLGAGSIQYATHTKDIEKLGGLIKRMPVTSVLILCFSLAISALVPFNGFIGEWLTLQSLFAAVKVGHAGLNIAIAFSVAALALAGALAAGCFIKLFGIAFLGRARSEYSEDAKEVPVSMRAGMGMLAALCLIFGIFPRIFLYFVDRVAYDLTGQYIADKLQGNLFVAFYPVNLSSNTAAPFLILLAVLAAGAGIGLLVRLLGGKYQERKFGTWDCGFESLNPRMQYSATGFSKPLRIVFRILYRPGRELEVEEGPSPYFPESVKYTVTTEQIFEKYLYDPIKRIFNGFSSKSKFYIQTGSVHLYLIYIFVTLLALMLYNRIV